jgi:hypothetical protein
MLSISCFGGELKSCGHALEDDLSLARSILDYSSRVLVLAQPDELRMPQLIRVDSFAYFHRDPLLSSSKNFKR